MSTKKIVSPLAATLITIGSLAGGAMAQTFNYSGISNSGDSALSSDGTTSATLTWVTQPSAGSGQQGTGLSIATGSGNDVVRFNYGGGFNQPGNITFNIAFSSPVTMDSIRMYDFGIADAQITLSGPTGLTETYWNGNGDGDPDIEFNTPIAGSNSFYYDYVSGNGNGVMDHRFDVAGAVSSINVTIFNPNGGGDYGYIYMNNVETTPEPSSSILLGFAGSALISRRKR